jgi:uncharacterized membrane protein
MPSARVAAFASRLTFVSPAVLKSVNGAMSVCLPLPTPRLSLIRPPVPPSQHGRGWTTRRALCLLRLVHLMPSREHYGSPFHLGVDLWRVPFGMCLGAVALFAITVAVDAAVDRGSLALPHRFSVGGADDARVILGAMLGAVSTVLALIFSVALLVLSMAVSNFGPRILYRFVRDAITQSTIGLFLASFVHTLLTLVVTRQDPTGHFVPQLTIMCGVVLVMLSFAFLVVFSHRIAMSIQTQNVVAHIVADLDAAVARAKTLLRQLGMSRRTPVTVAEREVLLSRFEAEGAPMQATRSGFVQEVDVGRLVEAARASGGIVRLLYPLGAFVLEGAELAQVVPAARAADLAPAVRRDIRIGTHRILEQDVEFGVAQLVEIALRALSPAVNDTFTGLSCIDWLGDEIRTFASMGENVGVGHDADGVVRVVWPPLRFAGLVKAAFDQIRQAAVGNPAVSTRLLQTFDRLAEHIHDASDREALAQQVEAIWEAASTEPLVTMDRQDVELAYRRAREALKPR